MNIERFFCEHLSSPTAAFTTSLSNCHPSTLPHEVREAAGLGLLLFPFSLVAKLTENPILLIGEATCEISRLEELAAEYSPCEWRVAIGPSSLCVLQLVGPEGRNSFAALSQDQGECLTLQAHRGDTAWAFFRWPGNLVLRKIAKKLAPGVRILADGDSCVVAPFCNQGEVEAIPYWLRNLAFETPDTPCGKTVPVPALSRRPAPCRSRTQFENPQRGVRKGYPMCGQAGWRGWYRISRQSLGSQQMQCAARVPGLEVFLLRRSDTPSALQEPAPETFQFGTTSIPPITAITQGLLNHTPAASTAHCPLSNQ